MLRAPAPLTFNVRRHVERESATYEKDLSHNSVGVLVSSWQLAKRERLYSCGLNTPRTSVPADRNLP